MDSDWCYDFRAHCGDDAHIGSKQCFCSLITRRTGGNRGTEPRYHAQERRADDHYRQLMAPHQEQMRQNKAQQQQYQAQSYQNNSAP